MGNLSVYGKYKGKQVRLTVFRLNGKVGLALDQEPIWLESNVAYDIADQLLDQADSIQYPNNLVIDQSKTKSYFGISKIA